MSTSGHSKDLKKNSKNTPFILSWRPKRYFWRRGRWRPQIFFTSLLLYIYLFQFHYLFNQFLSSVLVLGLLLFNVQERTFELNWCFCRQAQHRIFFISYKRKCAKVHHTFIVFSKPAYFMHRQILWLADFITYFICNEKQVLQIMHVLYY